MSYGEWDEKDAGLEDLRESVYKILVIGDMGVGKTSVIRRYVRNKFTNNCKPTIGVDFALKTLRWDKKNVVRAQLWDVAGQERFGHMTRVYYRDAVAAVVVFDVTRPSTFEGVLKWKTDLDSKCSLPFTDKADTPVPAILIANKVDLLGPGEAWSVPITEADMDAFCREHGFLGWHKTSAKEPVLAQGIDKAMREVIQEVRRLESLEMVEESGEDEDEEREQGERRRVVLRPGQPGAGGASWTCCGS